MCGRCIVGTDHYTSVSGCTGKQFSEGPEFVLWVHISFLRSEWIYRLFQIPYAIYIGVCLPLLILAVIVAGATCLSILPLLACTCCCCCFRDNDSEIFPFISNVMKYVFVCTFALVTFPIFGIFEIAWFPIAFALWAVTFPLGFVCRPDIYTLSYVRIFDPDRAGYLHMYWLFPLSAIEQFRGTSFTDLKTIVAMHLES